MDLTIKRSVIRASLESLVDQLVETLDKAGFVICGIADLQKEHFDALKLHHRKYKILSVDFPAISAEMLSQQPDEGMLLPTCISVIESYPGEVVITITNPSAIIASIAGDERMTTLARRVTSLLEKAVRSLEKDTTVAPDLVTSWD